VKKKKQKRIYSQSDLRHMAKYGGLTDVEYREKHHDKLLERFVSGLKIIGRK
jgi:hypothetical protein